jgi:hypothetical protein
LAGASGIWSTARIGFEVESVRREAAPAGPARDLPKVLTGEISPPRDVLTKLIDPAQQLSPRGLDMYIINDLGRLAGGVYYGRQGSVIYAQNGPKGPQEANAHGAKILAHELGHSLSLDHTTCTDQGNLMVAGCTKGADPLYLTDAQITAARGVATSGWPYR